MLAIPLLLRWTLLTAHCSPGNTDAHLQWSIDMGHLQPDVSMGTVPCLGYIPQLTTAGQTAGHRCSSHHWTGRKRRLCTITCKARNGAYAVGTCSTSQHTLDYSDGYCRVEQYISQCASSHHSFSITIWWVARLLARCFNVAPGGLHRWWTYWSPLHTCTSTTQPPFIENPK